MKFSENWLRTFVDVPLSTGELADLLTFGGIEIESVEPAAPAFEGVVVGEVRSVAKHPDADRLNVCQVSISDKPDAPMLTIVCGAPNVRVGMRVPMAQVGAILPGMQIKKAKVRGVESSGMLCSAKELGISDAADGLLELVSDAPIGANLRSVLDLDDRIFDSKPTPNRGDCLSVLGLAREVAALSGKPYQRIDIPAVTAVHQDGPVIELQAPQCCPLYCGRLIRDVNVQAPTPAWMVRRLARSGVRSISAVVDVTNYVMLELGHPLHAFDAAKLDGGIRVRMANPGEKIGLLNGETRELDGSYLVIADERKALALAGIMGGAYSAVGDDTRDILLEAAYFAPDVIAGKSRLLGFGSDAAYRFERGVNFAGEREAMERATRLLLEICGGRAGPVAVAQSDANLPRRKPITLRLPRIERVLGLSLSAEAVADIFARLGFAFECEKGGLQVTPPAYRFDIAIEEDLIEEVARIHGYDRIPATTPAAVAPGQPVPERRRPVSALRHMLAARDYQEVVTYSFVDPAWEADFCANTAPIRLANPIASQMAVMRSSLIGGLIGVVAYNLHHRQPRVRLFELGRCFAQNAANGDYQQPWRIAAVASGDAFNEQWGLRPPRAVDFYDVKSDLEALFQPGTVNFEAAAHPAFHPGKCARLLRAGNSLGWLGELHPRWCQKYGLSQTPVVFEVALDAALAQSWPEHSAVSKFPPAWRDLSLVFDENVTYQSILDAVNAHKPGAVVDFRVFDIYRGRGVENGKKSLAFRMLVQDTHKTMTDAEVDSAVSETIKILQDRFNAKLR